MTANQYREVARLRYEDAKALLDTKNSDRASGTVYLAGFVIECLLKAELMREYPWLKSDNPDSAMSADRRALWELCFRSHDIADMLDRLPRVRERLQRWSERRGRVDVWLLNISVTWKVEIRYSTKPIDPRYADKFVRQVKEIRQCLES